MRRVARFVLVLVLLLSAMVVSQGALTGACDNGYGQAGGFSPC
ncbi:MAG TPA: hypothetical protein VNT26_05365 [Candidatus Sulfotelmatobacter sp.]|nr:hypothetical protein [Candidatus Sulfotelmatobacter sp.]